MYKEQIDAYIDSKREEILEDVKALVRINSQRGEAIPGKPYGEGPAAAVKKAGELMEKYGLTVKNYDNYVITGDFGPGEKELDILAHLDVVPVTEDWTVTQPFEPVEVDGKLYGRGTADDKGPAVAALYAVRAVKELNIPIKKSIRLILGADEECGSSDLEHYYSIEKEAPCTFTPDADFPVINMEKARLSKHFSASFEEEALPAVRFFQSGDKVNVVPAKAEAVIAGLTEEVLVQAVEKTREDTGILFHYEKREEEFYLTGKGIAAHASTPEAGNSALTALLHLISLLPLADTEGNRLLRSAAKLFPHGDTEGKALQVAQRDEVSGALTMNLGILKLENKTLEGEFDCRAPLCATDENLTQVMREAFAKEGICMETGSMVPAHYVPEDSSFVQTLLESFERYTGMKGKCLCTGGGTYVHELERGVAFGCMMEGVDNHMHGDDEFMVIDTLLMSAKMFADVIVKLCC